MPIPTPEPPVDTYIPILWAILSADEQYAEYVRVRALLLQRAQEIAELKAQLAEAKALYEANHG